MIHLFRFDPAAAHIPAEGQQAGVPYGHGAWRCIMCRALETFALRFCADCPGRTDPAARDAALPGSGAW